MDTAALAFLGQRRSTPSRLLGEPGPDAGQLESMLQLAVRVPDHGRLEPWRFLRISGEHRQALGAQLAQVFADEHPDADAHLVERERGRFSFAPVIVAVIGRIATGHRIPEVEQRLSGGAVCLQLQLAAHGHGFGSQWLTGWAAYHPRIREALGLGADEEILGFIHLGTPIADSPERERPDVATLLADWPA
jgi:nitroreductase